MRAGRLPPSRPTSSPAIRTGTGGAADWSIGRVSCGDWSRTRKARRAPRAAGASISLVYTSATQGIEDRNPG
jgi:hypothetical protein